MLNKPLELKNVMSDDKDDLYRWRSHPAVQKNSFRSDPFSEEDHEKWFQMKCGDPRTTIYIAYYDGNKIGVIRFEEMNDNVQVNVMLNPEYIGKGFGARVIESGTKRLKEEKKLTKPVIAEIKRENEASRKAFEQAGYKMSDSAHTYGAQIQRMIYE